MPRLSFSLVACSEGTPPPLPQGIEFGFDQFGSAMILVTSGFLGDIFHVREPARIMVRIGEPSLAGAFGHAAPDIPRRVLFLEWQGHGISHI